MSVKLSQTKLINVRIQKISVNPILFLVIDILHIPQQASFQQAKPKAKHIALAPVMGHLGRIFQ